MRRDAWVNVRRRIIGKVVSDEFGSDEESADAEVVLIVLLLMSLSQEASTTFTDCNMHNRTYATTQAAKMSS